MFFVINFKVKYYRFLHAILQLKKLPVFSNLFFFFSYDSIQNFNFFLSLGIRKADGRERKASERKRSESIEHIKKVR